MTSLLDTLREYKALRRHWTYDPATEAWRCTDWTIELVRGLSTCSLDGWTGYGVSRSGVATGPVHATFLGAMRAAAEAGAR